ADAERAIRQAIDVSNRLLAARPTDSALRQTLITRHVELARLLRDNCKLKEAVTAYRELLEGRPPLVTADPNTIAAIQKSMELRQGGDSWDWFFLAMANWQLGETEEARKWYDKALEWMEKNDPKNDELRRFRAEMEELMKIKK